MERLDKVLSNLGILTRTECKQAIKKKQIHINDILCISSDTKIDPDNDIIKYNGAIISSEKFVYYMLYKPEGYITATTDPTHKTVFDLIGDTRKDLAAVGRLDKDTTGILLITNDGDLNHKLLSPKHHVPKRYEVLIDGHLTESDISRLENGIDIGDEKITLPAQLELLNNNNPQKVAITITEGRYHQVKRMFEAVNCPVLTLHRSHFGNLQLDTTLEVGTYRKLTEAEITSLKTI